MEKRTIKKRIKKVDKTGTTNMLFEVEREALEQELSTVCKVASNSILPILACVRIQANDKIINLTTSNLATTISCDVPATVSQPGMCVCPAKILLNVVSALQASVLSFSLSSDNKLILSAGEAKYTFLCMSADDFPESPLVKTNTQIEIEQMELKTVLAAVYHAISTDQSRVQLNGVFIKLANTGLIAVATDGRRLAKMEMEIGPSVSTEAIIPTDVVAIVMSLLGKEGEIDIKLSADKAEFTLGRVNIIASLVEGEYPNYTQVIPKKGDENATIVLNRVSLIETLTRASFFSQMEDPIKLSFAPGLLTTVLDGVSVGSALERIKIKHKGDSIEVSVNPKFIIEPLSGLDCEEITMLLQDSSAPVVIQADSFKAVIMPCRID